MLGYIKRKVANELSDITHFVNGHYASGILTEANGMHLLVSSGDMYVGRNLRFDGSYGREELKNINRYITPNSIVAFIGTHVGSLAIPTAARVRKAYLVEANPETFKFLKYNTEINDITNAKLFNFAAGEKDGEISFVMSRTNTGGSKREPKIKKKMYYADHPSVVKVPMRAFDTLVDPEDNFDLVFMDIEGSEYFALTGMSQVLTKTKTLIMEFVCHHLRNVANVTASELLDVLEPHFSWLSIPTTGRIVPQSDFRKVLGEMFEKGQDEEEIVFSKEKIPAGGPA